MKKFDLGQIHKDYNQSKKWREAKKYAFAIGTLGVGALYLWATTKIIKQGEIGLRRNNRGEMILLPPGRHSNFPWESYPAEPQSLSQPLIKLGPYTILCVKTGFIAKTYNAGKLEILKEGQHLLEDANHVFKDNSDLIPIMQETKKLQEITAYTSDNVGLTLKADVRYQITDAEKAISQIDDLDKSIKEIAEISISQIVSNHNLDDFAPVAVGGGDKQKHNGMSSVISELTGKITAQLSKLGIDIITIGITSWRINDEKLAHELAQGAVIKSQAESRRIAAERDALVNEITTKAAASARITTAESEATAVKLKGEALKKVAEQFKDNPAALQIYIQAQQTELVKGTNNPNLFFYQPLMGAPQLPQTTLPVTATPP